MISRRSLLGSFASGTVLAAASTLAVSTLVSTLVSSALTACGRKQLTEQPIDIMGETRESGDPLWLGESEAWIVADGATVIAVSGLCPYDTRRVGWCTSTNTFVCPLCLSEFDQLGRKFRNVGPAKTGLGLLQIKVSNDGSVVVNRGKVDLAAVIESPERDNVRNQCELTIPKTSKVPNSG